MTKFEKFMMAVLIVIAILILVMIGTGNIQILVIVGKKVRDEAMNIDAKQFIRIMASL